MYTQTKFRVVILILNTGACPWCLLSPLGYSVCLCKSISKSNSGLMANTSKIALLLTFLARLFSFRINVQMAFSWLTLHFWMAHASCASLDMQLHVDKIILMNCWWLQRFFYQLEAKNKHFKKYPNTCRTWSLSEASLKSCCQAESHQDPSVLLEEILQIKRSKINWADWRLYKLTLTLPRLLDCLTGRHHNEKPAIKDEDTVIIQHRTPQ